MKESAISSRLKVNVNVTWNKERKCHPRARKEVSSQERCSHPCSDWTSLEPRLDSCSHQTPAFQRSPDNCRSLVWAPRLTTNPQKHQLHALESLDEKVERELECLSSETQGFCNSICESLPSGMCVFIAQFDVLSPTPIAGGN